ncbi:MAG: beta-propeller domain-containing protein [Acidimicrobiia bacterium]|nr:beta-propeller domain-containing protein [Acidimicrobiia bacterium]
MRKSALIIALALVAAACTTGGTTSTLSGSVGATTTTRGSIPHIDTPSFAALAALSTVDSCDELLDHFQAEALLRVGPWGLDGYGGYYPVGRDGFFLEDFATATTAAPATEAPQAGGEFRTSLQVEGIDYSGTNNQVRGVDEADIVKTDGERIFAIVNNEQIYYEQGYYDGYGSGAVLVAVDVTDDGLRLAGRFDLSRGWGHEMFLAGDRVFVISNGSRPSTTITAAPNVWEGDYYIPQVGVTLVSEIDVSNPDEMEVVRDLYFDGTYVTSRLSDGTVRIVVRTQPTGLEFVFPKGSGLRAERVAEEANRAVISDSTIDNWLPYFVLEDSSQGITEGTLLDCSEVYVPEESAGLGLTAVLTLNTAEGVQLGNGSAAIFAQGETVYASADNLYIATNPWVEPALFEGDWQSAASEFATTIHRFDTSDTSHITYEGSGAVTGYLLNQFAMSEHEGHLRVASTDAAARWGFSAEQESLVSVMDIETMETVGQVGDLGKGEQIYSVRFIGDNGFVVTFRQVDPLYALDLSNPERPELLGELKINGYSAYLHPVGEDRLLGIGQDATSQGRILGTQVSLFDISDLASPALMDKVTLGGDGGNSEVEYDHRAFLYWAPAELAVLPIQTWSWDGRSESYFNGAIGVHVHDSEVHLLDRITHQSSQDYWEYGSQIRRSLVIGDALYTISDAGIRASDTDDLSQLDWVPFNT